MPNTAIAFGDRIGHIMNYGDGWYGGVFVGAMYALSFISSDIPYIVTEALKAVPRQSAFYQCVNDAIEGWRLYPDDWRKTWQRVQKRWGTDKPCPSDAFGPYNIEAKLNSAYIAIGLLYGGGDFTRTMEISTRCGQDSDCNPSSAGGILGCILGYGKIPEQWMKPLREVENLPFKYTDISLNKVYEMSFHQAVQVIQREGGSVYGEQMTIKTQRLRTVRFEQGFPNMKPVFVKGLGGKTIGKTRRICFYGCGVVIQGSVTAQDKDYVALVDVFVDGQKAKTMRLPAAKHDRANDIYWNFDLPQGEHEVTLKWLNEQPDVQAIATSYLVFGKDK